MAVVEVYTKEGTRLGVINDELESVEITEEWERRRKKRRPKREKKEDGAKA